jgi:hypothetical protein
MRYTRHTERYTERTTASYAASYAAKAPCGNLSIIAHIEHIEEESFRQKPTLQGDMGRNGFSALSP